MTILITGTAGFIGFSCAHALLKKNKIVIGVDNINSYYDQKIKRDRLKILKKFSNFHFLHNDLNDIALYKRLNKYKNKIKYILHFAGQAGVRYSIIRPDVYIKDNIMSFIKLLEYFKKVKQVKLLLFASSSSVYGESTKNISYLPQSKPISVYAASKLSMELISNSYISIYKMKIIGLRFFSVYGPWGRPDMAYYKFVRTILNGKAIEVYNYGNHYRSFTYIDDVVENIFKVINKYKGRKKAFFDVCNIGNPKSISIKDFIFMLEKNLKIKVKKKYTQRQPGDVLITKANLEKEMKLFKFKFTVKLNDGLKKFIEWYKKYHA